MKPTLAIVAALLLAPLAALLLAPLAALHAAGAEFGKNAKARFQRDGEW